MDLIDLDAVLALPATVLEEWGRIDVLFNNAIYKGVGTLDKVADLTSESMLEHVHRQLHHQVLLIQAVLPHMLERGGGTIIDMVSGSARLDPRHRPARAAGASSTRGRRRRSARVAGGINAEHLQPPGMKAFNVDPGNVVTEARKAIKSDDEYSAGYGSEPAEATGKVVAWLATDPGADRFLGKWIFAPKLCSDLGLLPGWTFQAVG